MNKMTLMLTALWGGLVMMTADITLYDAMPTFGGNSKIPICTAGFIAIFVGCVVGFVVDDWLKSANKSNQKRR